MLFQLWFFGIVAYAANGASEDYDMSLHSRSGSNGNSRRQLSDGIHCSLDDDPNHRIDMLVAGLLADHICHQTENLKQGESKHEQYGHIFANVTAHANDANPECTDGLRFGTLERYDLTDLCKKAFGSILTTDKCKLAESLRLYRSLT